MFTVASLWIPFTIVAALGQVARNAMQRSLTGPLGTWGATNIRFLFGFPFSLVFLAGVLLATGDRVPWPTASFWPWLLLGALSQIVATGLMLLAMNERSFVVTTAYLKTEAIQTAIFGFVFLGDHLTWLKVLAIFIATVGVVFTALRPGGEKGFAELRPTIIGLVAAGCFALSAIGFRGAIIVVPGVSFVTAASTTLVWGLFVQTLVLTIYLLARAPHVLKAIIQDGRQYNTSPQVLGVPIKPETARTMTEMLVKIRQTLNILNGRPVDYEEPHHAPFSKSGQQSG